MFLEISDDVRLALTFLTRLPIRLRHDPPPGALARAMRIFPLVGAMIGLAAGLVYCLARWLLPAFPAALLAVSFGILLTGALHEDGLADCADGFGAGGERERIARIMHDSRIGAFGALALILSVILRSAALAGLDGAWQVATALIACHALSRASAPLLMVWLAPASGQGLAAMAGRPSREQAGCAALGGFCIAFALLPSQEAAGAILASLAMVFLFGRWARKLLGGYSGDVLGATEQLVEIAALLAILAQTNGRSG